MKANSIESGIASATISAARMLPRKTNSTAITSSPAFEQVLPHCVDHVIDQFGPVVDRSDLYIRRQLVSISSSLSFIAQVTCVAVFAHQHEAQAQHDFALAVGGDCAAADLVADVDFGHVARRAPARRPWRR